ILSGQRGPNGVCTNRLFPFIDASSNIELNVTWIFVTAYETTESGVCAVTNRAGGGPTTIVPTSPGLAPTPPSTEMFPAKELLPEQTPIRPPPPPPPSNGSPAPPSD